MELGFRIVALSVFGGACLTIGFMSHAPSETVMLRPGATLSHVDIVPSNRSIFNPPLAIDATDAPNSNMSDISVYGPPVIIRD